MTKLRAPAAYSAAQSNKRITLICGMLNAGPTGTRFAGPNLAAE
jgi:hypothetical protein